MHQSSLNTQYFLTWCLCDCTSLVQRCKQPTRCNYFFLFIDLFKSALHDLGDKLAHHQEHFLTVYTAFGTMYRQCCRPVPPWHRSAALSAHCTKSCIYSQKCSWGWTIFSPETCRFDLKRLINENLVASCWLLYFLSLISSNLTVRA